MYIKMTKKLTSKNFIIFNKNDIIPKSFNTFNFKIHKGHIFRTLEIDKFSVGLKFGSFIFTRKPHTFIKKKKKSSNIIKR